MTDARPFDTRPWVLTVSVTLASMVCCGQAYGQEHVRLPEPVFTEVRRPCGIPFECVDAVRFRNAEVTWKLSFNPRLQARYDIVHWRRAYYGRAGQDGPREFVAQYVTPAGRMGYYQILTREKKRTWKRAWLGRAWKWRELKRPSDEYREAGVELVRVFLAANSLNEGKDPADLQF